VNRRQALLLAPFGAAVLAGAGFWTVLGRMKAGRFDPHDVPSQLIGRPMPEFALPAQEPGQGFSSADITALRRPVLVNFFASWCVPCVIEHPELMALSRAGVPIWGIAYKDTVPAASGFVARHGNPYARIARDAPGQVAIDWGVYGVPESYLIDPQGIVRWRMAGPLTPDTVSEQLQPLLRAMA
jgi:cytochrome c biogenesis protein CcmG/thiol:disulfide interchange protein DsbE